ncbi:MAG: AGE family epimerase/isomerase [Sphingomonas sp.]|jgi:mannose-6-phosphate isomerase
MNLSSSIDDPVATLQQAAGRGSNWLCNIAAPLWATRGRTASGLFAERMTLNGKPETSYFRTFVQARQVYSFCAAGRLGWDGPWRKLVSETIDVLLANARRADGFFVHRLDVNATTLDERADLYDQAFILFALGVAGEALGRQECFDAAEQLVDTIESHWTHPEGGFGEGEIVDPRVRRQNPHMHLLEASLALADASGRDRFLTLAKTIADLAADRMIDPTSGALLEYFENDFTPAAGIAGKIVEPGHCFEWAWLFERLVQRHWTEGKEISDRLVAFARSVGIDHQRGVAINEVLTDGTVKNARARLWPQTERIKAATARFRRTADEAEAREAATAAAGLEQYYDVPKPGLWRDKLTEDGSWVEELVPGSSLYHISCAYVELNSIA